MANDALIIPFYVSSDGTPLTGASAEMEFDYLLTVSDGTDKSGDATAISEIGGGWYKFSVTYGTTPFTEDLVGLIDADKDGDNALGNEERYIPVEVRLDFYGLRRLTETGIEIDGLGCVESDLDNNIKADIPTAFIQG